MQSPEDAQNSVIDRTRGLQDLLDARMRASGDENQSTRRSQSYGDFSHLPRSRHVRDYGNEEDAFRYLGRLLDPDKIRVRPRTAMSNDLRRGSVVVLKI